MDWAAKLAHVPFWGLVYAELLAQLPSPWGLVVVVVHIVTHPLVVISRTVRTILIYRIGRAEIEFERLRLLAGNQPTTPVIPHSKYFNWLHRARKRMLL